MNVSASRRVVIPLNLSAQAQLAPARAEISSLGGETMGTTWTVKLVLPATVPRSSVQVRIDEVLDRVVAQMSTWIGSSAISRFNNAEAGTWHVLPDEFYTVLCDAMTLAQQSEGAYDPTIGALVDLWGFGPKGTRGDVPPAAEITAALDRRGWQHLTFDRYSKRVRQPGGMRLDLSSIAKGFAVDLVADALERLGIGNFLVEIGGELRGQGTKPDGSPWWVALDHHGSASVEIVIALHGLSVATSGDGHRAFEADGRRWSHTIDPRTGYPVPERTASVTVLHRSCMHADALATALTVLGPNDGFAFACDQNFAAQFVLRGADGIEERLTPAFVAMLD